MTLDEILSNLQKDPDAYNHGISEQEWLETENRGDLNDM